MFAHSSADFHNHTVIPLLNSQAVSVFIPHMQQMYHAGEAQVTKSSSAFPSCSPSDLAAGCGRIIIFVCDVQ